MCCKHIYCKTFNMQMKYAAGKCFVIVRLRKGSIQCSCSTAKTAEMICYILKVR